MLLGQALNREYSMDALCITFCCQNRMGTRTRLSQQLNHGGWETRPGVANSEPQPTLLHLNRQVACTHDYRHNAEYIAAVCRSTPSEFSWGERSQAVQTAQCTTWQPRQMSHTAQRLNKAFHSMNCTLSFNHLMLAQLCSPA